MFTVLGARGFIGSHLAASILRDYGTCYCPTKDNGIPTGHDLGHVIDCVGLTADFRQKPLETMDAHVSYLLKVLAECRYDSLLYLSSTRVYGRAYGDRRRAHEDEPIVTRPTDPDELYNISKLAGEATCFAMDADNVRVVRLSNVYGYDLLSQNLVFTLIRDALEKQKIVLHTTLDSSKDYISISNVVRILPKIALGGRRRLYNVASGVNTTLGEIVDKLNELTGCDIEVANDAKRIDYPRVGIGRLTAEFDFFPSGLINDLPELLHAYRFAKEEAGYARN